MGTRLRDTSQSGVTYGATLAWAPHLLANVRLGQNLLEVTNAIITAVKVLYYRSVVIRKKK